MTGIEPPRLTFVTVYRLPIRLPKKKERTKKKKKRKKKKKEKMRDPGEKALARGVALLGGKVTGIEPPRLTFVTVYRRPIRLPAKSAGV